MSRRAGPINLLLDGIDLMIEDNTRAVHAFRKWLSRLLWRWSYRLYEDWHDISVLDGDGNVVFSLGCYGQWSASWKAPYDMRCSCEAEE